MSYAYNPIVRAFGQVRSILVNHLDVPRECVRPDARIADLVTPAQRPILCRYLRQAGFGAPDDGEHEVTDYPLLCPTLMTCPVLFLLAALLQTWLGGVLAVVLSVALIWASLKARRTRTVYSTMVPTTVGELSLCLVHFAAHPGYRFTRHEIALRVRMLVADVVGVPLAEVTEETNFINDFA